MKGKNFIIIFISLLIFSACNTNPSIQYSIEIQPVKLKIKSSLRGLFVVDKNIAWASGSAGVYLVTTDAGETWKIDSIPGASTLDLRSIFAFDEQKAIVVSAGTPARTYLTNDGGFSWEMTFSSDDPAIFFDAIKFWNDKEGMVMGDPVQGKLFLLKTTDGGVSWNRVAPEGIPPALVSEGGFAASGTCLATEGEGNAWIGVGGDSARVYRTIDQGNNWSVHQTPILCGSQMRGIFSLALKNDMDGIAVGGEWNINRPLQSRAFTNDGGLSWTLGEGVDSYCSGSCYVKDDIYLACGQSGIDISNDGGRNWNNISDLHLYGIKFDETGEVGFGSGPDGRIVKLKLVKN